MTTRNTRPRPAETFAARGYVMLLTSTLVLSTTGVLIRFLLDTYHIPTLALAFWRVLFVALAMGGALLVFRRDLLRVERRHVPLFALYGAFGVGLHQLVWIASVQNNGVGVATVLVYVQPAIVALISWRFLGESLDRVKVFALVLALSGVALVSRAYEFGNINLNALGIVAGIGTGFTWSVYALLGRYTARRYSAWTALFYAFAFGALTLLPLQLITPSAATPLPLDGWGVLLMLALGPTLGGFALYTLGLSQLPASVATLLGTLEPVGSIVLAYFLFGEVLNGVQVVGAAFILWSVVMLRPR